MSKYFKEVFSSYGTEFWSNNPSEASLKKALELGAVSVATNPCYSYSIVSSDTQYLENIIKKLKEKYNPDDSVFPVRLHEELLLRLLNLFYPIYEKSNGMYGLVAIQGDPRKNNDKDFILKEAERFHKLGKNIIIKVPSTIEGAYAMEELTARGWPTIGTMGFSVAQYIYMTKAYFRGLKRCKNKPPRCLITMIPGIFDEYIYQFINDNNINISKDIIKYAGNSVAREVYKIFLKNKYAPILLTGGLRKPYHWIELVGKNVGGTIGGSLALEIIKENASVESKINNSIKQEILNELMYKLPDFEKAYLPDGLEPEDFRSFGPTNLFQKKVEDCYEKMISLIKKKSLFEKEEKD